ncbi:hypothetical protein HS088_TW14G00893 [Tripterygium wilfordii]|uniref:COP1-interacting protein-related n=2 Tax=Tripterygium wilfordii TaxID=458696 RepID=A0A7J7CRQ4_TRIWF|nr:hypothetical protein HS088_TW14G00893 [Tripterygium wilfordii]
MFPPWPIHPSAGTLPVFQGYPMQGMPYYQNHQGNSPFFQSPYPVTEDSRHKSGQRMGQRRQSVDSGDGNTELETWEMDGSKGTSQDDEDREKGASRNREPVKKANRSGRKQSGMVVIRNINYITSKGGDYSGTESESASGSLTEEEDDGDAQASTPNMKHKHSIRSSKRNGSHAKPVDALDPSDKEGKADAKETDGGDWQAFQNYLLRDADEEERDSNQNLFAIEKEARVRRKSKVADDPLAFDGRDIGEYEEAKVIDMHKINGNLSRIRRSNDESLISRNLGNSGDGRGAKNGNMDLQSTEIDGRRGVYRRSTNDDFILRRQNQSGYTASPSDPLNGFDPATYDLDKRSPQNMDDDSYVVSLRSNSLDQVGSGDRNAIVMDSELPSAHPRAESLSSRTGNRVNYEPDELSLIPERGMEKGSSGYDPALDYEMQIQSKDGASLHKKNKEAVIDAKRGSKKSDNYQKSKITADTSDKKKTVGPIRKGKPAKPSPLDEARARAEKLRNFKADLQKIKKEKEEEQMKRLEALKIERQKRIAARSGSIPTQSPSQQTKKQLPTKLSPSSQKGSKFSDSEPGPVSPLQRFPVGTISARSNNSHKASKSSKLNAGNESGGNRLSRSVSSLPEPKKENSVVTPDTKASMARVRRLSEPKMSGSLQVSSMKPRSSGPSSKQKASEGQESKNLSAIVNHDRSKAASLPELKIKMAKGLSVAQGKSGIKEKQNKANDTKASTAPEVLDAKRNSDKISHHSDGDDNPIVEKTVVMLEYEKSSNPAVHASEASICLQRGPVNNYKIEDKTEPLADYAPIHAPVSSLTIHGDGREPVERKVPVPPSAREVTTGHVGHAEKKPSSISSSSGVEKPYQAPYARVSSLEDPCTGNSEYGRAPPTNLQMATMGMETVKVHVADSTNSKLEKITEVLDKPQIKESSKGFRRLLKFGKKTNSSTAGECNSESNNVSVNGSDADNMVTNASSSIEVHTLKNLISQDETPTASSTQKNGRHFSLLSPFRSKTSEKKLTI